MNVPGSPSWSQVFFTHDSIDNCSPRPNVFVDTKRAKDIFRNRFDLESLTLCKGSGVSELSSLESAIDKLCSREGADKQYRFCPEQKKKKEEEKKPQQGKKDVIGGTPASGGKQAKAQQQREAAVAAKREKDEAARKQQEAEQQRRETAEAEAKQKREAAEAEARKQREAAAAAEQAKQQGIPAMIAIPGKNYEIGKYEVTQKEWQAVMGNNPSGFSSCGGNCPVEQVSWNDIQEYLTKLNQKTGKQYRLPSEAEWEYACYGGSQSEYCGGGNIDAVAWYVGNSGGKTHPVGQKQANGYGLYDMSGNVFEWMEECWEGDCTKRVLRGGSWYVSAQYVRAARRGRGEPAERYSSFGFRLARTLP